MTDIYAKQPKKTHLFCLECVGKHPTLNHIDQPPPVNAIVCELTRPYGIQVNQLAGHVVCVYVACDVAYFAQMSHCGQDKLANACVG